MTVSHVHPQSVVSWGAVQHVFLGAEADVSEIFRLEYAVTLKVGHLYVKLCLFPIEKDLTKWVGVRRADWKINVISPYVGECNTCM